MPEPIIIVGASARAAAFSAIRAGLEPWCADLFADTDLSARCPVRRLSPREYPQALPRILEEAPPGPCMYTGALENHPRIVRQIAARRCLWGNDEDVLRRARSPRFVRQLLTAAGLPCPRIRLQPDGPPDRGQWLVKPIASAGGVGVRHYRRDMDWPGTRVYLQEYIEGEPCAAVYVGDGATAQLLGVTRQLIGEPWLNAPPFRYCGSIGPLDLSPSERQAFTDLGNVLAKGCGLRGIFGVDCIRRDGVPWPVEVNPRYTASVEVLEHALGVRAVGLHWNAFGGSNFVASREGHSQVWGKAILFARRKCAFPGQTHTNTADVPRPGEVIDAGKPILTIFGVADSLEGCLETIRRNGRDVTVQRA